MMPIGPASRADGFVGLVTRLDLHIGHPSLRLPLGQVLCHQRLDLSFPLLIGIGYRGKEGHLPGLVQRLFGDPLDRIEPFLEDVVRSGLEVMLLPATQSVAGVALGVAIVAAQGLDRGAVGFSI